MTLIVKRNMKGKKKTVNIKIIYKEKLKFFFLEGITRIVFMLSLINYTESNHKHIDIKRSV